MSSINPIDSFFETLVSPSSIESDGIKAVEARLDEQFIKFSTYVCSTLGIDTPIPADACEVEGSPMGTDEPLLLIHENVQQAMDGLRVLGLHINESLPLANLPYDQMTEVAKEAMLLCAEVSEKMIGFIEHLHEICLAVPPLSEPIPICFSNVRFPLDKLFDIHESLVDNYWIEPNCADVDFVYFFSGEGLPPRKRIGWVESIVCLSLFLKEMTDDKKVWQKASKIFEVRDKKYFKYQAVKPRSISATYINAQLQDVYPDNVAKVKEVLNI